MYNTVISKCVLILNLQLGTPGEFVKIAKDARKRPFAAHVWFSDICDSFIATILLGGVDFWGFFFTWEVLNNCFFINFIACEEQQSKKNYLEKWNFLIPLNNNWFFLFTKMLKALPLFFWNYSGKSFPKLAWDGKARFSAISSLSCAPLNCFWSKIWANPCCLLMELLHVSTVYLHGHLDYQKMMFTLGLTEHEYAHTLNFSMSWCI